MALFGRRRKSDNDKKPGSQEEVKPDVDLQEELSELAAQEHPRDVDRAKTEAQRTISDAALHDIRGITLIERGRCPDCGGRTDTTVSSQVCPSCGWYRWRSQEANGCIVQLESGEKLRCDRIYQVKGDQILCVRDDVVRNIIAHRSVRRIDYVWDDKVLEKARERYQRERTGVCDWCGANLSELEESQVVIEDHVAFGAFQEKYRFCCDKCIISFRKQYPTRIHRNCFETDCNTCEECIKRFDTAQVERYQSKESAQVP